MWRQGMAALCVAGAVSGCGTSGTVPAAQKYVHALRATGAVGSYSDSDLKSAGSAACQILTHPARQGYSYSPVDNLVHAGWDTTPAVAVSVNAQKYLCPSAPKTHLIH